MESNLTETSNVHDKDEGFGEQPGRMRAGGPNRRGSTPGDLS